MHGIVFAAGDAMGAIAGESWLRAQRLPLIALSGLLTASPLSIREALKSTAFPVFSRLELARPKNALALLALARKQRARPRPRPFNGNGNSHRPEAP